MRRLALILFLLAACVQGGSAADLPQLTPGQLNNLDRRGYLTPAFKAAVHRLVEAKQRQHDAAEAQARLQAALPDLQAKTEKQEAVVASLKKRLADFEHPDEADFAELQSRMKDPAATPEQQLALAQAYVWTYPASPHQTQAAEYLGQVQKKMADQVQAQKDADTARQTAQAKLLQRVKARDLSLEEWRAFLLDKTQAEVTTYLGNPATSDADDWSYTGVWTIDPATKRKAGLQITFNGGRVQNVSPAPQP